MDPNHIIKPTAGGLLSIDGLAKVRNALRFSSVALVPSDTCFAVAVDATDERALRVLRLVLEKPDDPLSVAFPSLMEFTKWANLGSTAVRVAGELLPGPLTLCAPMTPDAERCLGQKLCGDGTIGGRIPDSPIEVQLAASLGFPLTTTALRDDRGDLVHDVHDATEILESRLDAVSDGLGYVPLLSVVDARSFTHREHSTVVKLDAEESRIEEIRPGALPIERVREAARRYGPWDVPDDWT